MATAAVVVETSLEAPKWRQNHPTVVYRCTVHPLSVQRRTAIDCTQISSMAHTLLKYTHTYHKMYYDNILCLKDYIVGDIVSVGRVQHVSGGRLNVFDVFFFFS